MSVRVIKGGQARAPRRGPTFARVLRAEEQRVRERCEARLAEVEEEVAERLAAAEEQAQQRRDEVRAAAQEDIAGLLVSAQRQARQIVESAQADLTRLAVGIAEKILGAELSLAPERVVGIVAQVVRAAGPSVRLVARVNPLDQPLLEAAAGQLARAAEQGNLELAADPSVGRGGCILETDRGVADGRLEVQLATLEAALFADAAAAEVEGGQGAVARDTDTASQDAAPGDDVAVTDDVEDAHRPTLVHDIVDVDAPGEAVDLDSTVVGDRKRRGGERDE